MWADRNKKEKTYGFQPKAFEFIPQVMRITVAIWEGKWHEKKKVVHRKIYIEVLQDGFFVGEIRGKGPKHME